MTEPVTVQCEWCGKEFPVEPAAFVESGFSALIEEGVAAAWQAWRGDDEPETIPLEEREDLKAQMDLTDDQLNELLSTGTVEAGASIVCTECQDEALSHSLRS